VACLLILHGPQPSQSALQSPTPKRLSIDAQAKHSGPQARQPLFVCLPGNKYQCLCSAHNPHLDAPGMNAPVDDSSSDESDHDFSGWMDEEEFEARCKNDVRWYAYKTIPGIGRSLKETQERLLNLPAYSVTENGRCGR
jgi:hypothetical protein